MRERLTVLAPIDLRDAIAEIGREFRLTRLTLDVYDDSREVVDLYAKHVHDTDAFLLGGPIAYNHLMRHLGGSAATRTPVRFIPYNEVAIYRALFEMAQAHDVGRDTKFSVSIDHPAGRDVRSCLDEIQVRLAGLVSHEVTISEKVDELIAFHSDLWQHGEVSAILTSVYYVYRRMRDAGAPVYRIAPARSSVRAGIHAVLNDLQELSRKDKQIAVIVIRFSSGRGTERSSVSASLVHKKRLPLQSLLRDLGENLQGLVQWSLPREASIVSTRGQFERHGPQHTKETLHRISATLGVPAVAGVGFADAAHRALELALDAVARAETTGPNRLVAVDADGMVRLEGEEGLVLEYGRDSEDEGILSISRKSGLGVATINKITTHARQTSRPFTSASIASLLSITPRSARRILLRLENADILDCVGEEQPLGSGRPRRMFRLAATDQER